MKKLSRLFENLTTYTPDTLRENFKEQAAFLGPSASCELRKKTRPGNIHNVAWETEVT